jgi:uncharacterized cupin superfamily protein
MKRPIHETDLAFEVWMAGTPQELRAKALCDVDGRSRVGVGLLELPAGSDTLPGHFHSHEEEHLFVLAGRATLVLGEEQFDLAPGSYVCFPAGQPVHHHLVNRSGGVFRYLMIGERIAEDRVTHAPALA